MKNCTVGAGGEYSSFTRAHYDLGAVDMVGASAGALAATLGANGVNMEESLDLALQLSDANGVWERGGLGGVWGGMVREWLDELLPENAHARSRGRVHLLCMRVLPPLPPLQRRLVTDFASRDDLIGACMASVHIPRFSARYRGGRYVDASFRVGRSTNGHNAAGPMEKAASLVVACLGLHVWVQDRRIRDLAKRQDATNSLLRSLHVDTAKDLQALTESLRKLDDFARISTEEQCTARLLGALQVRLEGDLQTLLNIVQRLEVRVTLALAPSPSQGPLALTHAKHLLAPRDQEYTPATAARDDPAMAGKGKEFLRLHDRSALEAMMQGGYDHITQLRAQGALEFLDASGSRSAQHA
ncbi:hypothetical protein JKP88DRAFT_284944 [Tribonema minus]|uniref:Patatin n=1 Tax=Tribonema minus TaxID=303371 RepID=A0A835ZDH3_9STRA|nr:hypothetical protein JKP88DRAFT_284944 [Tribonema minus]